MTDLQHATTPPGPLTVPGGVTVHPLADRCFDCKATPVARPDSWGIHDGQVRAKYRCVCGHVWTASWALAVLEPGTAA